MKQFHVAVVGATGMVGQRFITLLEGHPWFKLTTLAASAVLPAKPMRKPLATDGRWPNLFRKT